MVLDIDSMGLKAAKLVLERRSSAQEQDSSAVERQSQFRELQRVLLVLEVQGHLVDLLVKK